MHVQGVDTKLDSGARGKERLPIAFVPEEVLEEMLDEGDENELLTKPCPF